jgi:hypothetical protein
LMRANQVLLMHAKTKTAPPEISIIKPLSLYLSNTMYI